LCFASIAFDFLTVDQKLSIDLIHNCFDKTNRKQQNTYSQKAHLAHRANFIFSGHKGMSATQRKTWFQAAQGSRMDASLNLGIIPKILTLRNP
jgi:hypothetical protein